MQSWKKTFYIIWTGQLFSTLTSSIVGFAVVFWLSIKTESAEVLSYAMIATLLPQILLGLFVGVYVDRWNRKWTMILSDSFIAMCTLVLCILFYLDIVEVWQVYILLGLRSVGSAFHAPSMQASIPLMAPESELMRISGINQMIYSISSIGGPAIGALLISIMDMTYILMLDVVGAIIACTSLLFVSIPSPVSLNVDNIKERHLFREIKEGLQAIFHRRGMAWLFICDIAALFFIIPISALYPLMTTKFFEGGAFEMSLVESCWGVGMLIGGFIIGSRYIKKMGKVLLIASTFVLIGLTFLFSGILLKNGFILFVILTGLSGLGAAIWTGAFTVLLQTKIEPDKLGRAFSTYDSLILTPSIPGLLATGFIAEQIGLSDAFLYSGIIIVGIGILLYSIPSVRLLDKESNKIDVNEYK